jgi:predicted Zn-ribbon and HTH transcriptional regulator
MRKDKVRAHCPRCRHQQIFVTARINHPLHLGLTLLTAGLWLISWIALSIGKVLRPWRCEHCGWHKPEFGPRAELAGNSPSPSKSPRHSTVVRPAPGHRSPLLRTQPSQLRP